MTQQRNSQQQMAMLYGTYMGLFWIVKFIFLPLGLTEPMLGLLFVLLTCAVPFVAYYMTRTYRQRYVDGEFSFFSAFVFSFQIYLFAAILTAIAHYVYFQYIDQGFIYDNILAQMDLLKDEPSMKGQVEQIKSSMNVLYELSPIKLTMQLLSQNVFYGVIFSLPVALFGMKRKMA